MGQFWLYIITLCRGTEASFETNTLLSRDELKQSLLKPFYYKTGLCNLSLGDQ